MTLLIVLENRSKTMEGTQTHALLLCRELNQQKKKYLLLYNKKNDYFFKLAKNNKINIKYLNFFPSSPKIIFEFLQTYRIKKKIKKVLEEKKINNILLYNSYLHVFIPKIKSCKIYCYNHAGFFNLESFKIFTFKNLTNIKRLIYSLYNKYSYYNYHRMEKVLCSSKEAIRNINKITNIEKKIVKVKNGIDLKANFKINFIKKRLKKKIILGIGRFSRSKGIIDFCKIACRFDGHNNIKFIYIAPQDDKSKDLEYKIKLKYNNFVTFLESMPNKKVLGWMEKSYIFLFLSHRESSSLSVLESLSCYTPIIVWKNRGNNEHVNSNKNGFGISYGDYDEVEKKIKFLISNPKIYLNLCRSARIYIKEFSITKVVNHLYKKVFV